MTFPVGVLRYEEPEVLSFPAIIAIAVGASVLFIVLIIVVILYRVKSRRNDDMMKKMRIQMDMLEARVANECKEGRAGSLWGWVRVYIEVKFVYTCICILPKGRTWSLWGWVRVYIEVKSVYTCVASYQR